MQLNSVIGGYKVIELIGEGSTGTVFRCLDILLEREVALKLLRPELTHNPQVVKRFRAEAIALACLNHPNIVTLHQLFCDIEHCFMVQEFVRGETLDSLIRRCGPMPWQTALSLVCQALEGLEHAHNLKVIHRNIKPANLILTESGVVKLMDFRVNRMLEDSDSTQSRDTPGMFKYMSPEQIQGQHTDYRVDIYAIGMVLYELLTTHAPFDQSTDHEPIHAHVEGTPKSLRTWVPNIPLRLEVTVLRALEKSPENRFQSAAEFRSELDAILRVAANDQEIGDGEQELSDFGDRSGRPSDTSTGTFTIQSVGKRLRAAVEHGQDESAASTARAVVSPYRGASSENPREIFAKRPWIRNPKAAFLTLLLLPVFFHAFYLLSSALRHPREETETPPVSVVESSPAIMQPQDPVSEAAIAGSPPNEVVHQLTIDSSSQVLEAAPEKAYSPENARIGEGVTDPAPPAVVQLTEQALDPQDVGDAGKPANETKERSKPKSASHRTLPRHKKLDGGWTIITD